MVRRATMLAAALAVTAVASLVWALPASAANLDGGCEGSGVSTTEDGDDLDRASAPGEGGNSRSDPFIVDYDGVVEYEGTSPEAFHDHSWNVDVWGISVKTGGSENEDDEVSTDGDANVDDYLPFKVVGLFYVSGGIDAEEGSCSGNMWVKLEGSPVGTLPWIGGLVLSALGALLVVAARPRAV